MADTHKSSVKSNFLYQVCYQVLILALPIITSPYVSRVLGAEGLGIYSYSYSVAYYFVLVSMLGVLNYGNRSIAKCRDNRQELDKTFSGIVTLHIIISLICIAAYIFYILFIADVPLYALMQSAYVLSGLLDITWFYYGIEKFKPTVARNTFIKIITVVLVFLLVKSADDLWIYCLIMSASMLVSQAILWMPLRRYVSYSVPTKEEVLTHFKPMLVLFVPTIAVSLYSYMDKIMIGLLSDKTQLGYYENASSIVKVAQSIIASLGTVMLPKMSNLATNKNVEQFYKYIAISMRYVMLLAFAMFFGLLAIAKGFAPFFWGDAFEASGNLIQILAITIPFFSVANIIRTQFLLPKERDLEYMLSVIAGAVVNLSINAVLIPQHGATGAAIATAFSDMAVCFVQVIAARKEMPVFAYLKDTCPFGVLGIVMFFVVSAVGNIFSNPLICLIIQVITGILVYCIPAFVILYVKKDATVLGFLKKVKMLCKHKGGKNEQQ